MTTASMLESVHVERRCFSRLGRGLRLSDQSIRRGEALTGLLRPRWLCDETLAKSLIEFIEDGHRDPLDAYIHFRVSWTTPDGKRYNDAKLFGFTNLMALPTGCVPMLTAIISDAYIDAHVYLLVTSACIVEARLNVQRFHGAPDEPFILDGELAESGPNIYPLPIHDVHG
jgi:hypothetical protein